MNKMELGKIEEVDAILCKSCMTGKFRKINPDAEEDFGKIIIHKKDCEYLNKLIENSIEV